MSVCVCNQMAIRYETMAHVCIGSLWIFNDLLPKEKEVLVSAATRKEYKRGEVIFHQDEAANRIFLIKAGSIKISKISEEGNEVILDIRKSGDFIGEQNFWDDFKYPGSAICVQDSYICSFDKVSFEKLIMDNPKIGLVVIKNLCKHIEFLNSRTSISIINDIKNKLYEMLIMVSEKNNNSIGNYSKININLSHEELGFLIGVHRVSVTKAMKKLIDEGLVIKEGRNLFIYNSKF